MKNYGKKILSYTAKEVLSFHKSCKEESKFSYGNLWYSQRKQGITNPTCRTKCALLQKKPFHARERNMQIKV